MDYSIYLVTDSGIATKSLYEAVSDAIAGGCTMVQLREKNISANDFYKEALEIKKLTQKHNIPLIINDRVDIAMAVDAGVHVGQGDLPAKIVRKLIGNRILGVSATNLDEALKAQDDGADYLGVGAMYSTDTKTDANIVTIDELKKICRTVTIPVVIIGGINQGNLSNFAGTGIKGIAVVSAIIGQKDIKLATENLAKEFKKLYQGQL